MYFTGNTIVIDYGDRLLLGLRALSELHAKVGDTVEPTTIVGLRGCDRAGHRTAPSLERSIERRARRPALARRRHRHNGTRERQTVDATRMYLVQILLPVYDNEGHAFEPGDYVHLRSELADRFGGVTAYMRAPARGVWKDEPVRQRATTS